MRDSIGHMLRTASIIALLTLSACASQQRPAPQEPIGDQHPSPSAATGSAVPVASAERTVRTQIWPGAKRCYLEALKTDPAQHGRIVLLLQIDPSGSVADASVASNTGLADSVTACVVGAARPVRFAPPGPGGSRISIPFDFVLHPERADTAVPTDSPGGGTPQTTIADPVLRHMQSLRDSVAARRSESASPSACVQSYLDKLDVLLEAAHRQRKAVLEDGPTATPALMNHYMVMLRAIDTQAAALAAQASQCP